MTASQGRRRGMSDHEESQDSQAVLEALRADLVLLSDPSTSKNINGANSGKRKTPGDKLPLEQTVPMQSRTGLAAAISHVKQPTSVDRPSNHIVNEQQTPEIINTVETTVKCTSPASTCQPSRENTLRTALQQDADQRPATGHRSVPLVAAFEERPVARMEISQQSPTQQNEDRDYSSFIQGLSDTQSQPKDANEEPHAEEDRTLDPDETGAVNFGNLSPSSQVSQDVGFENTTADWRNEEASQQQSRHAFTPYRPTRDTAPETPAMPKNPFGPKAGVAAPLGASQLFGQTQFSSALKKNSPTSSRPSPHLMLDAVSPNIITSPLKNRTNVSSPSVARTSSPTRAGDWRDDGAKENHLSDIMEETPSHSKQDVDGLIPESPTLPPTSSMNHRPIERYEPMQKSQERKGMNGSSDTVMIDPDDSDEEFERSIEKREMVSRKRARATEKLDNVVLPAPVSDAQSERSFKRKRTAYATPGVEAEAVNLVSPDVILQSDNLRDTHVEQQPSLWNQTAEESGRTSDVATAGPGACAPISQFRDKGYDAATSSKYSVNEVEVPATPAMISSGGSKPAPSASDLQLPALRETGEQDEGHVTADVLSSAPPRRRQRTKTYGKNTRKMPSRKLAAEPSAGLPATALELGQAESNVPESVGCDAAQHAEPVPPLQDRRKSSPVRSPADSTPESSAAAITRPRRTARVPYTPAAHSRVLRSSPLTTSSLTPLAAETPTSSSNTTPATLSSPASAKTKPIGSTSPTDKSDAQRCLRSTSKSESPLPLAQAPTSSRRQRKNSPSTNALHKEGSARVSGKATGKAANRSAHTGLAPTTRARGLFENMIFDVTFRPEEGTSPEKKEEDRKRLKEEKDRIAKKIRQYGGFVLKDGFEELFEVPPTMSTTASAFNQNSTLRLRKRYANRGFTAILTDCHSRKIKYMEALALGLPCLDHRWVSMCIAEEEVVDWRPYLLPAGPSRLLGDAIRSRSLTYYSATDARLVDIVQRRDRLLEGQSLLIVKDSKKRSSEQSRIFLAHALGPTTSRVMGAVEARKVLSQRLEDGQPFNWVYVDKDTCESDAVLKIPKGKGASRKGQWAKWSWKTELLHDELITQSLFSGKMLNDRVLGIVGERLERDA